MDRRSPVVSRLVAKVDSAAVQDGFDLYLHGFIVTDDGHWAVVQQGMNDASRTARRYHWLSEGLKSFVDEPHAAIDGIHQGEIVNLTDRRADASRRGQLELLQSLGPDGLARELAAIEAKPRKPAPSSDPRQLSLPHLVMPAHHDVRASDVLAPRLHASLTAAANRGPADFAELLLVPGVGARTVRALAMVAEVVHGAPYRFTDPARFSFAHGGKDRHPFPVPLRVYDETIRVMKAAVQKARLGRDDMLAAVKRLDDEARRVERSAAGPPVADLIAEERRLSHSFCWPQRLWMGGAAPKRSPTSGRRTSPLPGDKTAGPRLMRRGFGCRLWRDVGSAKASGALSSRYLSATGKPAPSSGAGQSSNGRPSPQDLHPNHP